jgi:zinc transport system substrate-binding protein
MVLILSAALLATGCGGSRSANRRAVVAAFYPLAFAAENVAPDANVTNLTPTGAEPHDLELTPRQVEAVQSADAVLYLGGGFMPALEDAARGRPNAVDLLSGLDLLPGRDGRADPHVWLDPTRYASIVQRTAEVLGRPAAADRTVAQLEALDRAFRRGLASCERRELVTSHAAFEYLADAYGLDEIALTGLAPEAEPSARDIEHLASVVRDTGATTVFYEPLVSRKLAETVAREAGARTASLDPLEGLTSDELAAGATYFSVMRSNLAVLRKALGCR